MSKFETMDGEVVKPVKRKPRKSTGFASKYGAEKERKERGTRGKYGEDKVRDELQGANDRAAEFDYERNYDARSSGGHIPKRAGDFTFFYGSTHGIIEVKQVAHDFRLPKKNFDPEKKFSKIRKRALAHGKVIVIVYHSTTKKWRVVPFSYFDERRTQPSWDLSEFKLYDSAKDALYMHGIPTHER